MSERSGVDCSTLFLQFYHNLVNSIRIFALSNQFVTESKQSIENIPQFLCCEVKVIFPLSHTKITSALTVSVTADRRAFILPIHSIWLSAFSFSVMPSRSARCFIRRSNSSCAQLRKGKIAVCRLSTNWCKTPFYAHGYTANAAVTITLKQNENIEIFIHITIPFIFILNYGYP